MQECQSEFLQDSTAFKTDFEKLVYKTKKQVLMDSDRLWAQNLKKVYYKSLNPSTCENTRIIIV